MSYLHQHSCGNLTSRHSQRSIKPKISGSNKFAINYQWWLVWSVEVGWGVSDEKRECSDGGCVVSDEKRECSGGGWVVSDEKRACSDGGWVVSDEKRECSDGGWVV